MCDGVNWGQHSGNGAVWDVGTGDSTVGMGLCVIKGVIKGVGISTLGMGLCVIKGVGGQHIGDGDVCYQGVGDSSQGSGVPLGCMALHPEQQRVTKVTSSHGTEPPAILAVTPSLKALVGEDVTLECWVSGSPPPQIVWYKGETHREPSSARGAAPRGCDTAGTRRMLTLAPAGEQAVAAFPAGSQRAVLRLQAVREEDAGLYGCRALGEAGIASDSTVLHVGCKSCRGMQVPQPLSQLPFLAQLPFAALRGFPAGRCWCLVQTQGSPAGIPSFGKMQEAQQVGKDKAVVIAQGHEGWGCKAHSVGLGRGGG